MPDLMWIFLVGLVIVWATLLYHCLTSDRHQGSDRMNWVFMLILAFPVAAPAYIYVMFLRDEGEPPAIEYTDNS